MKNIINLKGIAVLAVVLIIFDFSVAFGFSKAMTPLLVSVINKNVDPTIDIDAIQIHPVLLSASAKGIRVSDPQDSSKQMFEAGTMSLRLSILGFLSKQVRLAHLTFQDVALEVKKDHQGQLNIESVVSADKKDEGKIETLKRYITTGRKDWFGNVYQRIRSSLDNQTKEKKEPRQAKVEAHVTELPRGRKIYFESPYQAVFSIGRLRLKGGKVVLNDRGKELPPFTDIEIDLDHLRVRQNGNVTFKTLSVRGQYETGREGMFDIEVTSAANQVSTEVELRDIDMASLEPIYGESLPFSFKRGYLALDSDSRLRTGELESENRVKLNDYELAVSNQWSLGGIALEPFIEALNKRPELELKFDIGGTPEKPSFKSLHETLMSLLGDELGPNKVEKIKTQAKEKFDQLKSTVGDLFKKEQ